MVFKAEYTWPTFRTRSTRETVGRIVSNSEQTIGEAIDSLA